MRRACPTRCSSARARKVRGGARGRFIYFDTEYHPGTVIELSEVAGPKGRMFDLIRESSTTWDGITDPVRPFPDLSKL